MKIKKKLFQMFKFESRIKKLQSDLSISYAENRTLQDQLTSCDAKQNELQELIRNYEGTTL